MKQLSMKFKSDVSIATERRKQIGFLPKKRVDKYHPNMRESPPHTNPELPRVGVSEKGTQLSIMLCL